MDNFKHMTAQIVAAYADSNKLSASDLPGLIQSVYRTLSNVGEPASDAPPEPAKLTPAQIRKSITPDYLISFEDGRRFRTLKRHLSLRGLTPADYRAKWGLPSSYPIVAPSYSEARSALARSMGLGTKRKAPPTKKPARRPRPRKAVAP